MPLLAQWDNVFRPISDSVRAMKGAANGILEGVGEMFKVVIVVGLSLAALVAVMSVITLLVHGVVTATRLRRQQYRAKGPGLLSPLLTLPGIIVPGACLVAFMIDPGGPFSGDLPSLIAWGVFIPFMVVLLFIWFAPWAQHVHATSQNRNVSFDTALGQVIYQNRGRFLLTIGMPLLLVTWAITATIGEFKNPGTTLVGLAVVSVAVTAFGLLGLPRLLHKTGSPADPATSAAQSGIIVASLVAPAEDVVDSVHNPALPPNPTTPTAGNAGSLMATTIWSAADMALRAAEWSNSRFAGLIAGICLASIVTSFISLQASIIGIISGTLVLKMCALILSPAERGQRAREWSTAKPAGMIAGFILPGPVSMKFSAVVTQVEYFYLTLPVTIPLLITGVITAIMCAK